MNDSGVRVSRRFISLVADVRSAQRAYFDAPVGGRKQSLLMEAKRLEKELDIAFSAILKALSALDAWGNSEDAMREAAERG